MTSSSQPSSLSSLCGFTTFLHMRGLLTRKPFQALSIYLSFSCNSSMDACAQLHRRQSSWLPPWRPHCMCPFWSTSYTNRTQAVHTRLHLWTTVFRLLRVSPHTHMCTHTQAFGLSSRCAAGELWRALAEETMPLIRLQTAWSKAENVAQLCSSWRVSKPSLVWSSMNLP